MSEIDAGLEEIGELIGKPTGVIRLTADEFAVQSVLQPAIARFLPGHPGIRIEITTDYGLADIVDGRFDAGVRRGRLVAKDMIAVRIGPDIPMAVVCAPSYLDRHPVPKRPSDLVSHACINLRLPTHGEFLPWIFTRASNEHRIKVDGPLVYTSIAPVRDAALAGLGRLSARGVRAHCACVRATDRGAGCMAQDVRGLPPLLREPAARDLRVLAAGRRAEIPQGLTARVSSRRRRVAGRPVQQLPDQRARDRPAHGRARLRYGCGVRPTARPAPSRRRG